MKNRLKILTFFVFFLSLFFNSPVFAQTVEVDLFYLETCPHCHSEIQFLDGLKQKYSELKVNTYEASNPDNLKLMLEKYKEYNVPKDTWGLVPISFFGKGIYVVGFEDNVTGAQIESNIKQIIADGNNTVEPENKNKINIPFIGEVDASGFSPLVLAIIFGAIDGFNPCAMAALTFLLASLISSGTRKRVILIGGTFIFVSGFVYFLFIAAWFNLFVALAYVKIITLLLGIFVIFFAITILKEYYSDVICKFCEAEIKKDFISRTQRNLLLKMEKMTRAEVPILLSLLSVGLVAAGVNIIELFCSMGFPAAFTGMLANFGLSKMSFYLYLLVYIFFYMLDDMIIFLIAVATLSITQGSQKYLKTIKLISGILLLILGVILIFKPSLLNFA